VGAGAVFAVSNDRVLHAMEPSAAGGLWPRSGSFGWAPVTMNAPAQHRPPVVSLGAGPRVLVASQDGRVYCVDALTGSTEWESAVLASSLLANPAGLLADLVPSAPDVVVVGTRGAGGANTLFALDPATGATVTGLSFTNDPSQGGDGLGIGIITGVLVDYDTNFATFTSRDLAGGSSATVWCVDLGGATAQLVWSAAVGDIDGAPSLYGGRVYVGTNTSNLVALDAATGAVAWTFSAGDGPVKGHPWPRFGTSELVFATTNTVWSVQDNGSSAVKLWDTATISTPSIPLLVVGTDQLLVGGGDGTLYQLDADTGAVTGAEMLAAGSALGSPAADVVNGSAHVGAENGVVYTVELPLS
jgi:outer membrane protein assembly factor BamB